LVNARIVLAAYGVKESDIKPEYIKPNQAGDKLKDGALDAFFFVGGAPAGAIAELASSGAGIELVSLAGPQAEALRKTNPYLAVDTIAAGTYKDVPAVQTMAMGAQWVTSAKADTETRSPRPCMAKPLRTHWLQGTPRASSSPRKTRSRAWAFHSTQVPRSSTKKPVC
jgi:TRAP transporter TAXI family solute receptor